MSPWKRIAKWFQKFTERKPPTPPYTHVVQLGDPTLRNKATSVDIKHIKTPEIQNIIQKLTDVMRSREAVGLSAPQIGVPLRIFVMEYPEKVLKHCKPELRKIREVVPFERRVFINPEVQVIDPRKVVFPEACESLHGFSAAVPRLHAVEVSGYNEFGEKQVWKVKGWAARIAQHEMDHLEGKMFTDIMDITTFQNDCWYWINMTRGKYRMSYK